MCRLVLAGFTHMAKNFWFIHISQQWCMPCIGHVLFMPTKWFFSHMVLIFICAFCNCSSMLFCSSLAPATVVAPVAVEVSPQNSFSQVPFPTHSGTKSKGLLQQPSGSALFLYMSCSVCLKSFIMRNFHIDPSPAYRTQVLDDYKKYELITKG